MSSAFAKRFRGRGGRAGDLPQDAAAIPGGKLADRLAAWLTRVTVNACHDRQRSTWWNRWRLSDGEDAATELPSFNLTPEQEVLGREQRDRIWRCFQQLSPRQQEIFILRYLEGWSTDEVASILGLTNSSVKQHLFRAVRRLRKSLGDRP